MPKGKDIYGDLSKKMGDGKSRRKNSKKSEDVPASVNVYKTNKSSFAKSKNINGPVKRRVISDTEGTPTVNSSASVKNLIRKINNDKSQEQTAPSIDSSVPKKSKKTGGRKPKST